MKTGRSKAAIYTTSALVLICLAILFVCPWSSNAAGGKNNDAARDRDFRSDYEAVIYGNDNGLVSMECNAIAQTDDGYVWVGTYSGLYRYDGTGFPSGELDDRIKNVMCLYSDSRGRLWIGTNDGGLGVYDIATGKTRFYTTEDGLAANSIRSIVEDSHGNIYVGTVSYTSIIDKDGKLTTREGWTSISNVRSMTVGQDDTVCGVTNEGTLFIIRDDKVVDQEIYKEEPGIYYAAVAGDNKGGYLVGTSADFAYRMKVDGGEIIMGKRVGLGGVSYINDILYDDDSQGFFYCGETGLGHLDNKGKVTVLSERNFSSAVSAIMKDYQDNFWFASGKHGLMKLSQDPFMDVFEKAGVADAVVNAQLIRGNELYIGTDDGMVVLDRNTLKQKDHDFVDTFRGARIRHMMLDSKDNIWVSTYANEGLVKIGRDGELTRFNENSGGTLGGRFRSTLELSDGRVLAASVAGLTYIKDDKVIKTLGEEDGLVTTQILSMVEKPDGTVLAGSDGDGIYVLKDEKVVDHIGADQGLETQVVLRIVPVTDGYIYVTSNALYHDDGDGIKRLDNFPYTNNYDIYISKEGKAWISSSAGVYLVDEKDLLSDREDYNYVLLNNIRGLNTTLTANAWNAVDGDDLYICCSDGVNRISTTTYDTIEGDYKIGLDSVTGDDESIVPENGVYTIPSTVDRVQIHVAVLNYAMSDPMLRIYLEGGVSDYVTTCRQSELLPLSYTNMPYGKYTLHVEVLDDSTGEVARDETFEIKKQARLLERNSVRAVLFLLLVAFAMALAWMIARLKNMSIIKRQYDEIQEAKEEADQANQAKSRFLTHVSHEIRTPINTITGMNELILRDDTSKEVHDRSMGIRNASNTLLAIVDDILDLSKIEQGKMNIVMQYFDTAELLASLVTQTRIRCDKAGLELITDVDPNIPEELLGDEVRIRQVLTNLLNNAVKYTDKGSVTLSVQTASKDENSIWIDYKVSDTGIGIKEEDMERLFEPFERLAEPVSRQIQGTGLGLDISRQLTALMGGELTCESTYGEGSTFSFRLKHDVLWNEVIGEDWEEVGRGVSQVAMDMNEIMFRADEGKVLVVDDNVTNLHMTAELLARSRVQVDIAENSMEALRLAKENDYDVIFMDQMMPVMSGTELFHKMQEEGVEAKVVALTANAIKGERERCLAEGFYDFMATPISGDALEQMLLRHLPQEKIKKNTAGSIEAEEIRTGKDTAGGEDGIRKNILVIDDDAMVHFRARKMLSERYELTCVSNGPEGIEKAAALRPSLIFVDVMMPGMDGFEVLRQLKANEETASIPVVMMTGDEDQETEVKGFKMGASDFVRKPFVPEILVQRMEHVMQFTGLQNFLQEEVHRQTARAELMTRETMEALSEAVDAKDHYTNGHSKRVAKYATRIAQRMGMSQRQQEDIYSIGLLHDIGKIGVPESIINKTSRLEADEFEKVRSHTVIGYEILKTITEMPELATGARWHHERYDGNGYPDGLKGAEIPIEARIIGVADSYDAMTSKRSYSSVRAQQEVREELIKCKGTQFDPQIVDVLVKMIDEDRNYLMSERDE